MAALGVLDSSRLKHMVEDALRSLGSLGPALQIGIPLSLIMSASRPSR